MEHARVPDQEISRYDQIRVMKFRVYTETYRAQGQKRRSTRELFVMASTVFAERGEHRVAERAHIRNNCLLLEW